MILKHGDSGEENALVCADLHRDDGEFLEDVKIDEITARVRASGSIAAFSLSVESEVYRGVFKRGTVGVSYRIS